MSFLLRLLLAFVLFMVALGVIKFLFVKLFVLALWIGAIAFLIYIVSALVKKT